MSDKDDMKLAPPPRLIESSDAGDDLRAMLRAGAKDVPDEARLAAIAAKLGPIVGGPGGGGPSGGPSGGGGAAGHGAAKAVAAKGLAAGAKLKLAALALVAGGVVAGAGTLAHRVSKNEAAVVAPPSSVALVESAPLPPALTPLPSSEAVSAPATVVRPRPAPSATEDDPAEEVRLLERAQDALRRSPSDALALCAEHQRRFAHPTLAQEREVIAIEALERAGRHDEARARADRFAASYPQSTHLRRVREIVAAP